MCVCVLRRLGVGVVLVFSECPVSVVHVLDGGCQVCVGWVASVGLEEELLEVLEGGSQLRKALVRHGCIMAGNPT